MKSDNDTNYYDFILAHYTIIIHNTILYFNLIVFLYEPDNLGFACIFKIIIVVELHLIWFSSVQLSCSAMSDSLLPHGLQQARLPCPSPTLRVYPNSCSLSW